MPETVLALADRIVALQAGGLPPMPGRLDRGALRDYAQLPHRAELASLVDRIAALAHGVLAMERCAAFPRARHTSMCRELC